MIFLLQASTQNRSDIRSGFTETTGYTAASSTSAPGAQPTAPAVMAAAIAAVSQQQGHVAGTLHAQPTPSQKVSTGHQQLQSSVTAPLAPAVPGLPRAAGETDSGFWIPHSANNSGFAAPAFAPGPASGMSEPTLGPGGAAGGGSGMSAPYTFAPGAAPFMGQPGKQQFHEQPPQPYSMQQQQQQQQQRYMYTAVPQHHSGHGWGASHPPPSAAIAPPPSTATSAPHWSPMFDAPPQLPPGSSNGSGMSSTSGRGGGAVSAALVQRGAPPSTHQAPQRAAVTGSMFSHPAPTTNSSAPPLPAAQGGPTGAEQLPIAAQAAPPGKVIMFCNSAGRSVRDIFDDAGKVVRQEIVDVYVQRSSHPPTVRQVTIVQPRGGDAKIKAAYFARRITFTFPATDRECRKVTQSRRDAEVVRVKKHFLRKYLAETQAAEALGGGTLPQGQVNWAQRDERASSLAVARANRRAQGHTLDGTEAFGAVVHDSTAFHYHEAAYELDADLAGVGLPQVGGGAGEGDLPNKAASTAGGGSAAGGSAGDTARSRPARNLPPHAKEVLSAWLMTHIGHPYPSEAQKDTIQAQAHISRKQLNNWFTNARKRMLGKGSTPAGQSSVTGSSAVSTPAPTQVPSPAAAAVAAPPAPPSSTGMSALLLAASSMPPAPAAATSTVSWAAQGDMHSPSAGSQAQEASAADGRAPLRIPPMAAPTGATNVSFPGGMPPVSDASRSMLRVRVTRDRTAGAPPGAMCLLGVTGPMQFDQHTASSVGILPTAVLEEDECETRPVPHRAAGGGAQPTEGRSVSGGLRGSAAEKPPPSRQEGGASKATQNDSGESSSGRFGASFHTFSERSGSGSGSGQGGARGVPQQRGPSRPERAGDNNGKSSASGSGSNSRDGSRSGSAGNGSPVQVALGHSGGGDGAPEAPSGSSGADGDVSEQDAAAGQAGAAAEARGRKRHRKHSGSAGRKSKDTTSDGGSSQWSVSQTAESSSSGDDEGASTRDTPTGDTPVPAPVKKVARHS